MRNERLLANAGSGKTHALTARMIRLLAEGAQPREIAALTFTRKSAGEFLCAVFERLARAALDPAHLDALKNDTGVETLDAVRCREILGLLASQLGVLGMGTLDSLFARIARAFPLESGLPEDFRIAEEAGIEAARERSLAAVFARESRSSFQGFLDLLRRIVRKHGEREVFGHLLGETKSLHAKFLATPRGVEWGDPDSIWGAGGCVILQAGAVSPAADAFLQAVLQTHPKFSAEATGLLTGQLDLLRGLDAGLPWNEEISRFVKGRLCADNSSGTLRITKKSDGWLTLHPGVRAARRELLHAVLRPEFEAILRRSRSLHGFLEKFEAAYSLLVRRAGLVTFGDITDLLAARAADESWRTKVAYRIDQTYRHWLIDEFQDTSRAQWKILEAFVDEVLMDPEGGRSFFYVGDTKQAIYSWRGGDPDLFEEVFRRFNQNRETIVDAPPLVRSWRSCAAVLDFVNSVFGDLEPVREALEIPASVVEKWNRAWSPHTVSPKTAGLAGFATWVAVEKNEEADEESGDAVDQAILKILEDTSPWTRGLSCAVLQRDNDGVGTLAALLQARNIPVAVEGKTNPCVDQPLGAALLAALRTAAHPDDSLSRAVVSGFPAAAAWGVGQTGEFRRGTLERIAEFGFESTLRGWIDATDFSKDPFLRERADAILLAAAEFDSMRSAGDGIPDFLRYVENRRSQEIEAAGVVRVMTVHQSKGLGFDMVVAAGLEKSGRGNDGTTLALGPSPRDVRWGVLLPAKDFASQDDTLRDQLELQAAEKKYGELCLAYVALTRAKKALYVVTTRPGEKSTAKHFARHLALRFADKSADFGDPEWYRGFAVPPGPAEVESAPVAFHEPVRGTPKPVSPSSLRAEISGGTAHGGGSFEALALGTAVHAALATIEWSDRGDLDFPGHDPAVVRRVREFLGGREAAGIFTRPAEPVEVWRERAFDVVLEGQWVSGVFDRVHVFRDSGGEVRSATVFDFKTDKGTEMEIAERHAAQIEIYRQAVARLLALDEARVSARVVPVR